jgi:hypothetical protein
MITEEEMNNMYSVEIVILKEQFQHLKAEHQEILNEYDVYTECELNDTQVIMFEDFGIVAPKNHYDGIIKVLKELPEDVYKFTMYHDSTEAILETYGSLNFDVNNCHVLDMMYN